MARNLFQTVDFTCLATQKVAGLCETLSQSAQKGTVTRLWDFSPAFVVALGVVLALALALGACLVWLALDERRTQAIRNKRIPNVRKARKTAKTRNMRKVA